MYTLYQAFCIPSWILYWVICDYIQATEQDHECQYYMLYIIAMYSNKTHIQATEQDTTPNLVATSVVVLGNVPANQVCVLLLYMVIMCVLLLYMAIMYII